MTAIVSKPPDPGTLTASVVLARRLVHGQRASLMLPTSSGDELQVAASSGLADEAAFGYIRLGDPISGIVAQQQQQMLVNQTDPLTHRHTTQYETGSFISVPVYIVAGQIGVLNVADPEGGYFHTDDLVTLQMLAAQIGQGLAHKQQHDRIRQLEVVNRDLRRQVIDVLEVERQRIARELHDGAGHTITAGILRLDLALAQLPIEAADSRTLINAVRGSLFDYSATLHSIAFALRPRILQDLGLVATLRSLVRQAQECGVPRVELRIEGEAADLPNEMELLVFRTVQEALTNIDKHAQASWAEVVFWVTPGQLALTVEDNGVGLDFITSLTHQPDRASLGLVGIRERVGVFGGSFEIGPRAGGGTRLTMSVPR